MKIKLGDVVRITWEDAWSSDRYTTYEKIKSEPPLLMFTVGHVIRNDKTGMTLGRETSDADRNEYRYVSHIPRENIRKIKVLK